MPKVSFIVPCFDQWQWLPDALASIKAQTVTDHETVLVCETQANMPPQGIYLSVDKIIWHKDNIGLAEARNSGVRLSQAEFVVPLDADDTIEPAFLERTLASACGAAVVAVNCEHGLTDEIYKNNYLNYCALFSRPYLNYFRGYQQPHPTIQGMEDWDLWIRMNQANPSWVVTIPDHLFNWRRHPGSMSSKFEGTILFDQARAALMTKNGLSL